MKKIANSRVYDNKCIKTKIKTYEKKTNTDLLIKCIKSIIFYWFWKYANVEQKRKNQEVMLFSILINLQKYQVKIQIGNKSS